MAKSLAQTHILSLNETVQVDDLFEGLYFPSTITVRDLISEPYGVKVQLQGNSLDIQINGISVAYMNPRPVEVFRFQERSYFLDVAVTKFANTTRYVVHLSGYAG